MSSSIYDGRRFHPIATKPTTRTFVAFDTEDDSQGHTLYTSFHDGETSVGTESVDEAIQFLLRLSGRRRVYVVAHNLEYDLMNLFRDRLGMLELHYFGGRLMSAKLAGSNVVFWDSLNHSYHMPLSKLGVAVGLPKLSTNLGWTKGRKLTKRDKRYAGRDSHIVWLYMTEMQNVYQRMDCEMKTTTPATSLDYWRRHYMPGALSGITTPVRRFFKRAYYGGRVEIFQMRARGPIRYYDINSLYPTVMCEKYPDINRLTNNGKHGVVDATVYVPPMHIPPLPVRRDKLIFPTGTFRGHWCTVELDYAKTLGVKVRKIHNRIGSPYLMRPFAEFVRDCYARRRASKSELENIVWKFVLNSLYGKFGTDGAAETVLAIDACTDEQLETAYLVGPLAVVREDRDPPTYANILWAAWTTALARIRLHQGLLAVSRRNLVPLYCDTDSIFYKGGASCPLPVGGDLGEWKLEATAREFEAKAPKVYSYVTKSGRTIKAKGVPAEARKSFFDGLTAEYTKPVRMREAHRRGMVPNVWIPFTKALRSEYDKRIILKSGSTRPHDLSP